MSHCWCVHSHTSQFSSKVKSTKVWNSIQLFDEIVSACVSETIICDCAILDYWYMYYTGNQLQWSSYLMCYVLGKFFQLPCLVQCCLSAIRSCLNTNIAQALLEFSKSIDCQSLQQLCQNYIELPWPT